MSESERDAAVPAPAPKAPRPVRFRHLVAAMAATAVLAGGLTAYAADAFSDVPSDHAFHDEIGWMAATGISEGYPDGTYRPTAPVSRQAMSAFMQRLYNLQAGTSAVTTTNDSSASAASPAGDPWDSNWVNASDLVTDVVVPAGAEAQLSATFTGETICNGGVNQFAVVFVIAPRCQARLLYVRIGGPIPGIAQAMSPNEFDVAYSDLTDAQIGDSSTADLLFQNETFTVTAASPIVGSGTWRVTPQIRVNNGGGARQLTMDLNGSALRVDALLKDAS